MGRNTFGIWNENAYQLWMDVSTLSMLMDELPEDLLRASQIADGLERYTRIVDFEQPAETRDECYRQARASLRPLLECHNGSTAPLMAAVGNSHLDLAWLWPMQRLTKDGAYICRPAASFGTISGIPLYPKPAGRLRDVPGALPRAV